MQATFCGELSETPVANLFGSIAHRRLSGMLRLRRDDSSKVIYFEAGTPVFAASDDPNEQLEHKLLEQSLVSLDAVEEARSRSLTAQAIGWNLIEIGALTQPAMERCIRELSGEIVVSVFKWNEGECAFYEESELGLGPKLEWAPAQCVLSAVRGAAELESTALAIAPDDVRLVQATATPDWIAAAASLNSQEGFVLSSITSPTQIVDVSTLTGLPERESRNALCVLISLGLLKREDDAAQFEAMLNMSYSEYECEETFDEESVSDEYDEEDFSNEDDELLNCQDSDTYDDFESESYEAEAPPESEYDQYQETPALAKGDVEYDDFEVREGEPEPIDSVSDVHHEDFDVEQEIPAPVVASDGESGEMVAEVAQPVMVETASDAWSYSFAVRDESAGAQSTETTPDAAIDSRDEEASPDECGFDVSYSSFESRTDELSPRPADYREYNYDDPNRNSAPQVEAASQCVSSVEDDTVGQVVEESATLLSAIANESDQVETNSEDPAMLEAEAPTDSVVACEQPEASAACVENPHVVESEPVIEQVNSVTHSDFIQTAGECESAIADTPETAEAGANSDLFPLNEVADTSGASAEWVLQVIERKLNPTVSDDYTVLGVPRDASTSRINTAYEKIKQTFASYRCLWPDHVHLVLAVDALMSRVEQAYTAVRGAAPLDAASTSVLDAPAAPATPESVEQPSVAAKPADYRPVVAERPLAREASGVDEKPAPAALKKDASSNTTGNKVNSQPSRLKIPSRKPLPFPTLRISSRVTTTSPRDARSDARLPVTGRNLRPELKPDAPAQRVKPEPIDPIAMAEEQYKRGRKRYDRSDFHGAAHLFREASTLDPSQARYHLHLGIALSVLAQARHSRHSHTHEIGCHVTCTLGGGLARNPRLRHEAERHMLKAAELDRSNPEITLRLAKLYQEAGMEKKAGHYFLETLMLDAGNTIALRELGMSDRAMPRRAGTGGRAAAESPTVPV